MCVCVSFPTKFHTVHSHTPRWHWQCSVSCIRSWWLRPESFSVLVVPPWSHVDFYDGETYLLSPGSFKINTCLKRTPGCKLLLSVWNWNRISEFRELQWFSFISLNVTDLSPADVKLKYSAATGTFHHSSLKPASQYDLDCWVFFSNKS